MRTDNIVRFTYIRDRRRNPIGGVAFVVGENPLGGGPPVMRVGAAFCSDKDRFNKHEARRLAHERLDASPLVKIVDQNDTLTKVMFDALTIATMKLDDPNDVNPQRFLVCTNPKWTGSSHRAKAAVKRMRRNRGV